MPELSQRSLANLETCDPRLQQIAQAAIKIIDFAVVEGHRGQEEQDAAFAKGTSQVRWPHGRHNATPSLAMDVVPWPVDWSNKQKSLERFIFLHGILYAVAQSLGIKTRHGIDWNMNLDMRDEGFRDYPHVELVD